MRHRSAPPKPAAPYRRRRWIAVLAVLAAIVAGAAGYLIAERRGLAERLVRMAIADAGLDPAVLTVAELDPGSAVVRNLRIGPAPGLIADEVILRYDPAALLERRIGTIALTGLRLPARLSGDGISVPALEPWLTATGLETSATASPGWAVDAITIRDSALEVSGVLTGRLGLDGTATLGAGGSLSAAITTAGSLGEPSRPPIDLSGTVEMAMAGDTLTGLDLALSAGTASLAGLQQPRLEVTGELSNGVVAVTASAVAPGVRATLEVTAGGTRGFEPASVRGSGTVTMADASILLGDGVEAGVNGRWQLGITPSELTVVPAAAARVVISAGDAPVRIDLPATGSPLLILGLGPDDNAARLSIPETKVTTGRRTLGLRALTATWPLAANAPIQVQAARLDFEDAPTWVPPLSLDARLTAGQGTAVTAAIADPDGRIEVMLDGTFDPKTSRFDGNVRTLAAGQPLGTTRRTLTLSGEWRMTADGEGIALTPVSPVTARLEGMTEDPVALEVAAQNTPALIATTTADGTGLLAAQVHRARIVSGSTAVLGGLAATLTGLAEPRLDASVLRLSLDGVEPWLAALVRGSLSAGATVDGGVVAFTAEARSDKGLRATLSGRHNPVAGTGRADIRVDPIRFRTGGRQPHDLYPPLRPVLAEVSGHLRVDGRVRWSGSRLDPDLLAAIEELSFRTEGIPVTGLSGRIRFNRLDPPGTPRGQRLTIDRIDPGIPLREVAVRFHLDRRGRPAIEGLEFRYLGGTVATNQVTIDPGTDRIETTVQLRGVTLQALIALGNLDDMSASGQITGTIPIRIEGRRFAIDHGRLAAAGPGVLAYRPDAPPAALQGAGEGASLMLRALENFHFSALSLDVDGQSGGAWRAVAHIAGHNPDLLDGQPFQFNINLTGDIEETIRAALFGADLPTRLEERLRRQQGVPAR